MKKEIIFKETFHKIIMAENNLTSQSSETMTTSQYAESLASQRKQISSQRFPSRTLRFQQETISKLKPEDRSRIEQKKEEFVGKREQAIGKITTESKRVAGEIEKQLELTGSLDNYEKYYSEQPQEFKQFIKSPSQKKKELQDEISKIDSEIAESQRQLERYKKKREEADDIKSEHSAEEKITYYRELQKRLSEGKGLISGGRFLSASDVKSLARDYARAEEDKREFRNEQIESGKTGIYERGVLKGFADLGSLGSFGSKVSVEQLKKQGIETIKSGGKISGFSKQEPASVDLPEFETTMTTSQIQPTQLDGITAASKTTDLSSTDSFNLYGTDISTSRITGMAMGVSGGDDTIQSTGNIFTRIGSIFNKKSSEGKEKAQSIFTGKVVSAAEPGDILKGEQFREQGEIKIFQYGTTTPQIPAISTKTFTQLREESLLFGTQNNKLFEQKNLPKSTGEKILEFTPIVGQIKPTIEAGRKLSTEYSTLVSGESFFGAGQVSQKEFRKAAIGAGLQTGLLVTDISATGSLLKSGVSIFRTGVERSYAKSLSKGLRELGDQSIRGINIIESQGDNFILRGYQRTPSFRRDVQVTGEIIRGDSGYLFVPVGEGKSVTRGLFKSERTGFGLFGGRGKLFVSPSTFEVSTGQVSRELGGELSGGIKLSRAKGFGTFTETSSSQAILSRGKNNLELLRNQLKENLQIGERTIIFDITTPQLYRETNIGKTFLGLGDESQIFSVFKKEKTPTRIINFFKDTSKETKITKFGINEKSVIRSIEPKLVPSKKGRNLLSTGTELDTSLIKNIQQGLAETQISRQIPFSFRTEDPIKQIAKSIGAGILGTETISKSTSRDAFDLLNIKSRSQLQSTQQSQASKQTSLLLNIQRSKSIGQSQSELSTQFNLSPTITTPMVTGFGFNFINDFYIFPRKKKERQFAEKKKERRIKRLETPIGYLPSFTAAALNIRGGRTQKILGGKSETFGIRPILNVKI